MKQYFVNCLFKKTIASLFFFAGVGIDPLSAQGYLPTVKTPASPIAASFNVYGEIPVSKYTGIPDISIPLYTIDLNSLQIPISLSYHPAGVRVEAEASWVGLGWTLNAGGIISREIKGLDDLYVGGHWYRYNESGSSFVREHPIPLTPLDCYYGDGDCGYYLDSYVRSDIDCSGSLDQVRKNFLKTDCEPDLFTYNFLGYSGRFVMKEGQNSAVLEKPEDGLFIRIDKVGNDYRFRVTTPAGDNYYFDQCERSTPFSGNHIFDMNAVVGKESATSWYLTSIDLADGNYIYFEYDEKYNIERNVYTTYTKELQRDLSVPFPSVRVSKELSQMEIPSPKCGGIYMLPEFGSVKSEEWQRNSSFGVTELFLKRISWSGGNKIDFSHSKRRDYGYPYDAKDQPVCLTGFEVRNQANKLIKGYSFGYSYFEPVEKGSYFEGARLRLDWLKEYHNQVGNSLPAYSFTYDIRHGLPLKTSLCFDVWGYYNGSAPYTGQMESQCPEIVSNKKGDRYFDWEYPQLGGSVVVQGRNMRCNPEYITTGMLKRIDYPTGGFAEFTFEPNTYISYSHKTEKKGGGVRIAKIRTDASERFFDYNDNGKSSGLLLVQPIFHYLLDAGSAYRSIYNSRSVVQLQGTRLGNYVGYGKVTETVICDGKKSSTVDYFHNGSESIRETLYTYDIHDLHGLLEKTSLYNDSVLVFTKDCDYRSLPVEKRPNQHAMKYDNGVMYCYDVFPSQHKLLDSENQIYYFSNGRTQTSSTYYNYNDNYTLKSITKSEDGKELLTKTIYSSDLDKGVYSELNENHVIKPVEVTQYIRVNNTEKVIGSQLILYNDRAQPLKVYKLETDTPLSYFVPFTSTAGDNKDSRYSETPELELSYYDGNTILPEETITRDGMHEFFIWGHSGSYVLAKIENATKQQITQFISKYDDLYEDEPTDAFYQKINNLRTQLPQARVTTYIYDSLIGLKQCINPDGTSVYYEYDNHNRLKCIKDTFGKVIEEYQYGYKK